jgi:hypothetical protein
VTDTAETTEVDSGEGSSRRDLIGRGAIVAAVAAVAGVALAKPAAAANNGPLLIGVANTGSLTTQLSGGSSLRVSNGTSAVAASIVGETNANGTIGVYGIDAASSAASIGVKGTSTSLGGTGVYGESTDSIYPGSGVIGTSAAGAGVVSSGNTYDFQADGSGRILLNAAGASNPPTVGFKAPLPATVRRIFGTATPPGSGESSRAHRLRAPSTQWNRLASTTRVRQHRHREHSDQTRAESCPWLTDGTTLVL